MADITMPKMGFDMTEGTIVRWLKKVGDFVNKGEAVAEIETDKVTIEIESFVSGTLSEIVSPAGSRTAVGGVIARTSDGAGAPVAAPVAAVAPAAAAHLVGTAPPIHEAGGRGHHTAQQPELLLQGSKELLPQGAWQKQGWLQLTHTMPAGVI